MKERIRPNGALSVSRGRRTASHTQSRFGTKKGRTHHGGWDVGGHRLEIVQRRCVCSQHEVHQQEEGAEQGGHAPAGRAQDHVLAQRRAPAGRSCRRGRRCVVGGRVGRRQRRRLHHLGDRRTTWGHRNESENLDTFLQILDYFGK